MSSFFSKKSIVLIIILLVFASIYSSISLVNHYFFRTYGLDLGIYTNVLWDYAHLQSSDYSVLKKLFPSPLADHFSIVSILYAPFYWLFGSYTLLIIQISAVLFGGIGIYKLAQQSLNNWVASSILLIQFFSIWGIFSALSFDYHDNVVGAMFVPWIFFYHNKRNYAISALFFGLLILTKENMALWGFFVMSGLTLLNWKRPTSRKFGLVLSLVSIVYFLVVLKILIPSFNYEDADYFHFKFHVLGESMSEVIINLLLHPIDGIKIFFTNHLEVRIAEGIKQELYYVFLCSGGVFCIIYPQHLWILIPIFAQKMLHDDPGKWGINAHYSIEFAPIISLSIIGVLGRLKNWRTVVILLSLLITISTIYITNDKLHSRKSIWYSVVKGDFLSEEHYQQNFDVSELNRVLDELDESDIVSATNQVIPHVACRDFVYLYPEVYDANVIVLLLNGSFYPLGKPRFTKSIENLKKNPDWDLVYDENKTIVFRKKQL